MFAIFCGSAFSVSSSAGIIFGKFTLCHAAPFQDEVRFIDAPTQNWLMNPLGNTERNIARMVEKSTDDPFIKLKGYRLKAPDSDKSNIMKIFFPRKQNKPRSTTELPKIEETTPMTTTTSTTEIQVNTEEEDKVLDQLDGVLLVEDPLDLGVELTTDADFDGTSTLSSLEEDSITEYVTSSTEIQQRYGSEESEEVQEVEAVEEVGEVEEVEPSSTEQPTTEKERIIQTRQVRLGNPRQSIHSVLTKPSTTVAPNKVTKPTDKSVRSTKGEFTIQSPKSNPTTDANSHNSMREVPSTEAPKKEIETTSTEASKSEPVNENKEERLGSPNPSSSALLPSETPNSTIQPVKQEMNSNASVTGKQNAETNESTTHEPNGVKNENDKISDETPILPERVTDKDPMVGSTAFEHETEAPIKVIIVGRSQCRIEADDKMVADALDKLRDVMTASVNTNTEVGTPKPTESHVPKEEKVATAQDQVIATITEESAAPVTEGRATSVSSQPKITTTSKPNLITSSTTAPRQTTQKPKSKSGKEKTDKPSTGSIPNPASAPASPHPLFSRVLLTAPIKPMQVGPFMQRNVNKNPSPFNPILAMASPLFRQRKRHAKRAAASDDEDPVYVRPKAFPKLLSSGCPACPPCEQRLGSVQEATRRPSLFEKYRAMNSEEKAEKMTKALEKLMHGVKIASHIDGYISHRLRSGMNRFQNLYAPSEER